MDNDKAARPQPPIDRPDPAEEPPAGSVGDARPSDAADTPAAAPALAEAAEPAGDEAAAAPPKPRVIVMHASVGSGHRSAAMAVAQAFELLGRGGGRPSRYRRCRRRRVPSRCAA